MRKSTVKSHRLAIPSAQTAGPKWINFKGRAQLVGTSPSGRVTVYVDPNLGANGQTNGADLLNDADRVIGHNDTIFGNVSGNVNVIIFAFGGATDGSGGADHAECNFTSGQDIEVCADYGAPMRVSGLFEAELSECSMGGNLCGQNTGEALSRWCAMAISNNALPDFASAPTWFNDGMPNFVNKTDQTDQNQDSTGCGMAFLSWLQGPTAATNLATQFTLPAIAQAMVALTDQGTLAGLYASLTGDAAANAWAKFTAAVKALPGGVTTDDPFGGFVAMP